MTAPKKLDFTSPARVGLCGDEEDDYTDATPLTLKRSKLPASEPPVEQQEEPKKKKKKKKKKSASSSDLIWNVADELTILKGLVEFRTYTETGSQIDWDLFYDYIKGSLSVQVSKKEVFWKIKKLRKNFLGNNGEDANFTSSTDPQAFKLSTKIWGNVEDEEGNVDAEPVNDNEAAKTNTDDEPRHDLVVPNENKSGEEEPRDDEAGDDELTILKGLFEFRAKQGNNTKLDWDEFYTFIKDLIQVKVPEHKVFRKIWELKNKFLDIREKIHNGIDPGFMKPTEPDAFKVSFLLWGTNDDAGCPDKCAGDQEGNANAEHVNHNDASKTNTDDEPRLELPVHNENKSGEEELHDNEPGDNNCDGEPLHVLVDTITDDHEAGTSNAANGKLVQQTVVDINTEHTTLGEENSDEDLCTLQEVVDTTPISQGLPGYLKKLMCNKLINLEPQDRKEFSDEWKVILSERTRLSVKLSRFSAKLVEAAMDG